MKLVVTGPADRVRAASSRLGIALGIALVGCSGGFTPVGGGGPSGSAAGAGGEGSAPAAPSASGSREGGAPASSPDACASPADPTSAAICVHLAAEDVAAIPADAARDERGVLWIAAYGSPDAAPASLLAETTLGTASAPIDLHALPPAARLGDLHVTTAYVRAVFFDDAVADDAPIAAGSWIAGYDLDDGLVEAKLAPVALSPGEIVTLPLSLVALRDLVVTVRTAPGLFPLGDGRGAVRVLASAAASLETTATMRFFGEGELACADPEASAGARVRGYVAGPGPAWIFAALDDFGAGGLGPAGGLVSVDHTTPTAIVLPDANRASYAQDAYRVEATVWLTTAVPRSSAAPDALTCF